jgi:D-xylose transport system permease protein
MLGMGIALALIWVGLDLVTDGVFLTARNLYNLAVQTSVVGVMATGMVLVIVARHIDLSVGSVLGFTGMAIATLQAEVFPTGSLWGWPLAVAAGVALGIGIGLWQGYWVAYRGVPAFVVTLAGLLMFRGGAYLLTDGRTVAPLDSAFQLLGGGVHGSVGAGWSWLLALAALGVLVVATRRARQRRVDLGIATRPAWAEWVLLLGAAGAIVAFTAVMNAYTQPRSDVARGIPVPVLILIVVALGMTALARLTRFGRWVFALGGNPEAAALAGIDVRRVTLLTFALMGALAAVAAVITTARLNAGTNSMGTLAELNVIAAAVIGGTSLAGGSGGVPGAILGAVIMQSLENGMVLLGVSSPLRQVAIGLVLIAAVWVDSALRRRNA